MSRGRPTTSLGRQVTKRLLDLIVAVPASLLSLPIVGILVLIATIETGEFGLFRQQRIGRGGEMITVRKIRTMRSAPGGTVTVAGDPRVTSIGRLLRSTKLDELPQLWNVLFGTMSLVGPRPDVAGFADVLVGTERCVLDLRPGITGPASILFRREESFLSQFDDPHAANLQYVWPVKVSLNVLYAQHATIADDVYFVYRTIIPNDQELLERVSLWNPSVPVDDRVQNILEHFA